MALDSLNLQVEQGSIFGFLGRNGAGKTTTIRCLLGLSRPSAGQILLAGEPVPSGLPGIANRIGAVLEDPSFPPDMVAVEALKYVARLGGLSPTREQVDAALDRVGLTDMSGKRIGAYSQGMRIRLALAAAICHGPELLILDEPTNGLDPFGLRDLRELLMTMRDSGVTVFISSHLLSEVERICDQVCMVDAGRVVYQGGFKDLGEESLLVTTGDKTGTHAALIELGFDATVVDEGVEVRAATADAAWRALASRGIAPSGIAPRSVDLEAIFARLVEG